MMSVASGIIQIYPHKSQDVHGRPAVSKWLMRHLESRRPCMPPLCSNECNGMQIALHYILSWPYWGHREADPEVMSNMSLSGSATRRGGEHTRVRSAPPTLLDSTHYVSPGPTDGQAQHGIHGGGLEQAFTGGVWKHSAATRMLPSDRQESTCQIYTQSWCVNPPPTLSKRVKWT